MGDKKRHTKSFRCPVCGGCDDDKRGVDKRCFGFTSDDGEWVRCTREEYANGHPYEQKSSAWVHCLKSAIQVTPSFEEAKEAPAPVPIAFYNYDDEDGKLLFQVVRYHPKGFKQRRPDEGGAWIWGLGDTRRVLFRHRELKGMEKLRILIVDGEKDVNTAWDLGWPATCCPGGMGSWKREYNQFLKGFKVAIVADRDGGKGEEQAEHVLSILQKDGIEAYVIECPGEEVKDLTDWVEKENGTLPQLEALIERRVDWKKLLKADLIDAAQLAPLVDEPIPYLINPLVVRGMLTEIVGVPKGGKSAFSLYLSLCATLGKWDFPEILSSKEPLKALYIPYEDPKILMAKRMSLYVAGLGFDRKTFPTLLKFIFKPEIWLNFDGYTEAVVELIRESGADIVVFDTLSYIHRCNEIDNSEMVVPMANLARIAEKANVGVVYIHHAAKNSRERLTVEKGRGAGAIQAAAHIIVDWAARDKGTNMNEVTIQSKFEHGDIPISVDYMHLKASEERPEMVKWGFEVPPKDSSGQVLGSRLEIAFQAVEKLIPMHPAGISRHDLAAEIDKSSDTCAEVLEMLVSKGKVFKSVSGGGRGKKTLFKITPSPGLDEK